VFNFSLVSLVNYVLCSFSDESFSVGDGFFQLGFLGSQDVGQSGLSISDLSFSFVDQVGQSSDFTVMFIGSFGVGDRSVSDGKGAYEEQSND